MVDRDEVSVHHEPREMDDSVGRGSHDCTDGFMGAFWRRPESYLDPSVRAGISTFPRLDQSVVRAGLEVLLQELQSGRWAERNRNLLDLEELDLGYRLVVAELD